MKTRQRIVVTALLCATFSMVSTVRGSEGLRMHVTPAVCLAPAVLTVRVTVEPAADNRLLQITAESRDFFRSSEVQVNGDQAAPLNVFEFRNMPKGLYHVTSVLTGVGGRRATAFGLARVEPAPGPRR
jgi:hypothetical protein